jgi:hypothetical protein
MLVALVLVLARDRALHPRGRLPVDLAQAVTRPVLAQLVELQTLAAAAATANPECPDPVLGRQQLVAHRGSEVRVRAHGEGLAATALAAPQAEARADAHLDRLEAVIAALERPQQVVALRPCSGRQLERDRQSLGSGLGRMVVAQLERERARRVVLDAQPDARADSDRHRVRHVPLDAGSRPAPHLDCVGRAGQREHTAGQCPRSGEARLEGGRDPECDPRGEGAQRGGCRREAGRVRRPRRVHSRGASTSSSTLVTMASALWPSISASGESCTRWRNAGSATVFTSSGIVKSRPASSA